jgi:hypothetical protein
MLFEPSPPAEAVVARRHQLRGAQREAGEGRVSLRVKLADTGDGVRVAGADGFAQLLGLFPEILEGRIVRQLTDGHSDLLSRTRRASGLRSAPSGEEVACLN